MTARLLTPEGSNVSNPSLQAGVKAKPRQLFGDLFGSANKMTNITSKVYLK